MSYNNYPANQVPANTIPLSGVAAAGVTGAVVTGTAAAAREIRKVREQGVDKSQAVATVAKESAKGGLAVAAGAMVGRLLFRSNILGAAAMLATSVGVMYLLDGAKCPKKACATEACTSETAATETDKEEAKTAKAKGGK